MREGIPTGLIGKLQLASMQVARREACENDCIPAGPSSATGPDPG